MQEVLRYAVDVTNTGIQPSMQTAREQETNILVFRYRLFPNIVEFFYIASSQDTIPLHILIA